MDEILKHFKKNDPLIFSYFLRIKLPPIKKENPKSYFFRLCKEIICQQLSGASGDAIFSRFKKLFTKNKLAPEAVIGKTHEQLRNSGMSNAKARYIRNLAEKISSRELIIHKLDKLSDGDVVTQLTKVKGIGPWTAEMFLIFALGREDVFSFGDLGLRKAVRKLYKFKSDPTEKQIAKIITRWSPYKSYASRILWASLELQ